MSGTPEPAAQAPVTSLRADEPVQGILLVVTAVALFSCSDALAKYLNQSLPPVEIAWLRYLAFTLFILPVAFHQGRRVLYPARPSLQLLRGFAMAVAAVFFITGIGYLPLAEASAASFVAPAFVTAFSIPLLGEKVGWRRWVAVLVGLTGVMIVLRPGGESFQMASIFPLLSAVAFALGIVITRKMSGHDGASTTLIWSAVTGLVVMTILVPFSFVVPTPAQLGVAAAIGGISALGQFLLIRAYRFAEASVLAPYTYIQLVWAAVLGYLVFDAIPDLWTFIGTGVIIASGLYTAHRERIAAHQRMALRSCAKID
ncbi:DMT family transporter [Telmatospirillum sp. J64-1]|uniref:DMT family transporter n=1 Tax=Telmatospirillum sp. J64-1 TaxID=2502183 RepID=UPI00115D8D8B|nr:DMT family transporter [Telmatospirillum sp. J64-1]